LIRHDAIKQIGRRRLIDAAPQLERLVAEDDELKLAAMLALERLALPESRRTFLQEFDDQAMRRVALRGLFAIGDPEAVP
jgi:HEAT repeat protein